MNTKLKKLKAIQKKLNIKQQKLKTKQEKLNIKQEKLESKFIFFKPLKIIFIMRQEKFRVPLANCN